MPTPRSASRSIRAVALDAGKAHRQGVLEISSLLRLPPVKVRRELVNQLKSVAKAGQISAQDLKAMTAIVDAVTGGGTRVSKDPAGEVDVIGRELRAARGCSPYALVLAGIAADSLRQAKETDARRRPRTGVTTRKNFAVVVGAGVADISGALAGLLWSVSKGASASFTVDEMIRGAVFCSAVVLAVS